MRTKDKPVKKRRGMRKPIPTPQEQQIRFLYLAMHLKAGKPLTKELADYLADGFLRISAGESADVVFHLKRGPGQSEDDELRRQKISVVFAHVAELMCLAGDGYPGSGDGLSLDKALEKAAPLARRLFGVEDSDQYDALYLRKLWYDPSYAHMRTPVRTPFDPDSPVPFINLNSDLKYDDLR
ncbi:MAG: hypothetical protein EB117_16065 [Betaproteobacteria bacterium]|nr:hypothetical protein [Betaproteobacteria bacterium]